MTHPFNNPSVNLATGVAYVDGRTGKGWVAGASAGGGRGRTTCADRLRARANGEGGTARGLRGTAKPQSSVARLWLVITNRKSLLLIIDTSNLVYGLKIASPSLQMTNFPRNGRGHVT